MRCHPSVNAKAPLSALAAAVFLLFSFSFLSSSRAQGRLDAWHVRNQEPTILNDVIFEQNRFVAVGGSAIGGTVAISPDGYDWRTIQPGLVPVLHQIVHTNNVYVVLGSFPLNTVSDYAHGWGNYISILTSEDAEHWTERLNGLGKNSPYENFDPAFAGLAYFNGQFVALDFKGTAYLSPDGTNWVRGAGVPFASAFSAGSDRIAGLTAPPASAGETAAPQSYYSPDGLSWTARALDGTGGGHFTSVFGGGRFLAASENSNWFLSDDGMEWNSLAVPDWMRAPAALDHQQGHFWASMEDKSSSPPAGLLGRSADGTNWTQVPQTFKSTLQAMAWGNNRLIAVGTHGKSAVLEEGGAWIEASLPATGKLSAIAHGGGQYVAVGAANNDFLPPEMATRPWLRNPEETRPQLLLSSDGTNWSKTTLPDLTGEALDVVYGDGRFVAAGRRWVACSENGGRTWLHATNSANLDLLKAAYGNGLFATAGGGGKLLTSTDGKTWESQVLLPDSTLSALAYGNGRFVGAGFTAESGFTFESADGRSWNIHSNQWAFEIEHIAFGNGKFMIVDRIPSAPPRISADGITWTNTARVGREIDNSYKARAIAGPGMFLVSNFNGAMWGTVDGSEWIYLTHKFGEQAYQGIFADGRFTFAGNAGSIIQSDRIATQAQAAISVVPGRPVSEWEASSAKLVISRSADSFDSRPLTVHLAVAGTASEGEDYRNIPRAIEIPAGKLAVEYPIEILADGLPEGEETIEIQLAPGAGYNTGENNAAMLVIQEPSNAVRFRASGTPSGPGSFFTFNVDSPPEALIEIQTSPDLIVWHPWFSFTNVTGSIEMSSPPDPDSDQQFYKAIMLLPP